MKKFSFILLFSILTVFLLSGCSDDNDNNGGNTGIEGDTGNGDSNNNGSADDDSSAVAKSYIGTYDVTFFATTPYDPNGTMTVLVATGNMSTDCNKADELGILTKVDSNVNVQEKQCSADGSNDAKIVGQQAVISYDEKTGLTLETKLQMWSDVFSFSQDDVYQYTKYTSVPNANVTSEAINNDNTILGVSGRNLTTKTSNPKSTFKVTKMSDGALYVELELIEKSVLGGQIIANAPTYVILNKKSKEIETIDPNTLFTTESGIEAADKVYAKFMQNLKLNQQNQLNSIN